MFVPGQREASDGGEQGIPLQRIVCKDDRDEDPATSSGSCALPPFHVGGSASTFHLDMG